MTSEVMVMNTNGIALGADRAVSSEDDRVCYMTDKIIGFSGPHAIGAMMYGSADIFHVQWKTLIRLYEQQLEESFETVKDYALHFIHFLNHQVSQGFMEDIHEVRYLESVMACELDKLYVSLLELHEETHRCCSRICQPDEIQDFYKEKAASFLQKRKQELQEKDYPAPLNEEDADKLSEEYGQQIDSWIPERFEEYLYAEEWTETVKSILVLSVVKDFSHKLSGIIFAGYGSQNIFPSAHLLIIDGKVNGKVKFFTRRYSVHPDRRSLIVPFAQRDMAKAVMNGIHEEMEEQLSDGLHKDLRNIHKVIMPQIKEYLEEEEARTAVQKEINSALQFICKRYEDRLAQLKNEKFSEPLLHSIKMLPAKELASVAESLVHIAPLKGNGVTGETSRQSADVAIITKDRGFAWKRRGGKHEL